MAFRVKDLMINIASGEGANPGLPGGGFLSRFPCHCGCTYGYTTGCGPTITGPQTQQFLLTYWSPFFCTMSHTTFTLTPIFTTPTLCPTATVIGPVTIGPGGDPGPFGDLATMKAQLQQALVEIDRQEQSAGPQTVAEVEELQGKLRDALNELEQRKSDLRTRSKADFRRLDVRWQAR